MKINIESETVEQLFSYGSSLVFGISLVLTALWVVTLALRSPKNVRDKQPSHLNQDESPGSDAK